MRYIVKYHQISGDWLVFDMGDDLELVGMYKSEQEATDHATRLEEAAQRRRRWAREPALKAA
jgi:hypothetical protein